MPNTNQAPVTLVVASAGIEKAFAEWHRRSLETPEEFDWAETGTLSPKEYGERCGQYLFSILAEQEKE